MLKVYAGEGSWADGYRDAVLQQRKLLESGTGLLHGHLEHLINSHLGLVLGSGCLHG